MKIENTETIRCPGCRKDTPWLEATWQDGIQYCKKCIEHIWRQEKDAKQNSRID